MAEGETGRLSEEARSTLDYLIEDQNQFSNHAIEVIKINLLVGSLVLTAGSVLSNSLTLTPVPTIGYVTGGIAVISWLGSIISAQVTYFGIETSIGVSPTAVDALTNQTIDNMEDVEELLLNSYADWIRYSSKENAVTARRIQLAFVSTTVSIVASGVTLFVLVQ
jgi:hypothetical protein